MAHTIVNYDSLATTKSREDVLSIVEAGYSAIDTTEVIKDSVVLSNGLLRVKEKEFLLADFQRIFIVGFGKASCRAVQALEDVLDSEKITEGIVIDKYPNMCRVSSVYAGAHPLPSHYNVEITEKIVSLAKKITERDLVIVVVSGGGSSLLCWPMSEYDQSQKLYNMFMGLGASIEELNTIRKHLSLVKGGGLAKLLYPATVVSLIFCDVPGERYEYVASGPTYLDTSTIADAENVLKKYNIPLDIFTLNETPKDAAFFERVHNIPLVSNVHALRGMEDRARSLGYSIYTLGSELYDTSDSVIEKMKEKSTPLSVVIAGGEPSVKVTGDHGVGGRNEYICVEALSRIDDDQVFVSFASDGIDNLSDAAGGIIDSHIIQKSKTFPVDEYMKTNKQDELLEALGARIMTGQTGSNVSDLLILLRA